MQILHKFSLFNLKKKKSKAVISEATTDDENNVSATTPGEDIDDSSEIRGSRGSPLVLSTSHPEVRMRIVPPRFHRAERQMSGDSSASSTSSLSTDSDNLYQRDSYQSLSSQSSIETNVPQNSSLLPRMPWRHPPPPPYCVEAQEPSGQPSATQQFQPMDPAPSTSMKNTDFDAQSRYSFDEDAPPDETIVTSLAKDLPSPLTAEPASIAEIDMVDSSAIPLSLRFGRPRPPRPEITHYGNQPQRLLPGSYPQSTPFFPPNRPLTRHRRRYNPRLLATPVYLPQWRRDFSDAEEDGLSIVDPFESERLRRMEEEDRALAEELQRLEIEELEATQRLHEIQAKEISRRQERDEIMRLEDLKRIAQEDELLAQALMKQEQAQFDAEQRQRREKEIKERKERERRENLVGMVKASAAMGVGAPVAVRRVNSWGKITEASINELTPEVVKHLKHVKEVFTKSIPEQKITKLEWIVNPRLEAQFESTRAQLKKAKHNTKEILLFHGTEAANINKYIPFYKDADL